MKFVDGNKPGNFPVKNENNAYQDQEPLRLKYAAQILAGMWANPHQQMCQMSSLVMMRMALDNADDLIAEHNLGQGESEE